MHFQYSEDEGKQGGGVGKGLGGAGGAGAMGGGNPVPPPPPDGSLLDGLGMDAMGAARGKALKDKKARDKKTAAAVPATYKAKEMTPTGVSSMVTQAQLAQVTQSLQLQGQMGAMEKKKKGSTPPPPPPPDESGLGADVKSLSAIGVVSMLQMDEAAKLPASMTGLEAGKDDEDYSTGEVPAVAAVAKVRCALPRLHAFPPVLEHSLAAG